MIKEENTPNLGPRVHLGQGVGGLVHLPSSQKDLPTSEEHDMVHLGSGHQGTG